MTRPRSVVSVANEVVPISTVCALIGMDLDPHSSYARNPKVHCPFGEIYHRDGGVEAAFRLYPDTNSAWCFACGTYFTPVWLAVQAWGGTATAVATTLLERVGHHGANAAQAWAHAATYTPTPDVTLLAEALKTYCARVDPGWDSTQFAPPTAALLSRCLALLDLVTDEAQAHQWLAGCKQVMRHHLRR